MSAASWIFLHFLAQMGVAAVLGLQALRALRSGVIHVGGHAVQRQSDPHRFWLATGVAFFLALIFGSHALYSWGKSFVQAVQTFLGW
jgi:hypothetical protein